MHLLPGDSILPFIDRVTPGGPATGEFRTFPVCDNLSLQPAGRPGRLRLTNMRRSNHLRPGDRIRTRLVAGRPVWHEPPGAAAPTVNCHGLMHPRYRTTGSALTRSIAECPGRPGGCHACSAAILYIGDNDPPAGWGAESRVMRFLSLNGFSSIDSGCASRPAGRADRGAAGLRTRCARIDLRAAPTGSAGCRGNALGRPGRVA
jgi:hypothetical protein